MLARPLIQFSYSAAIALLAIVLTVTPLFATPLTYPWLDPANRTAGRTIASVFSPPTGFTRVPTEPGSFAAWLRGLPLKAEGAKVQYYDGRPKWDQTYHAAVIDIDTGKENLQQCADAVMRLRAEYLLTSGRVRDIAFNDTKGKRMSFRGGNYPAFKKYMRQVFSYAGTYSLEREMRKVDVSDIQIGDVFIQGGFPGHAVMVVDAARNEADGETRFLLMQSYMPAQDMHVLVNPKNPGSPWYSNRINRDLVTPEWIFTAKDLRRFKN